MKQLLIYLFIGTLGLSSCSSDFLNVYPQTSVSSGTFYKTPEHFEQATVGTYVRLRRIVLSGIIMDEMRSDNAFYTMYAGDRGPYLNTEVIALFLDDQNTGSWISDRYNEVYNGIARANTILARLDGSSLTDSEKSKFRAEALFLRAFYYFDLVTHWGGVPLMLDEVSGEDGAFIPKSTAEEVYDRILADVSESISIGLPVATTFPQSGRATMGAAKMLRAYAYMSKPSREYAKAEQDLKDITNMNYGLLDNYKDVFSLSNKNSKESIFEVQYLDGDGDQHSDFPWRLIPKCSNLDLLMGINANNYAYTSGGWTVPTQELIDSYEDGDLRLNATIAVAEGTEDVSQQFTFETLKEPKGYVCPPGKAFHYFTRKYYNPPYSFSLKAGDNFPLYRYSGALLLLAECLVEQGKNSEALPYINQVRARAGLPALTTATKKNVSDEMRHELAFENHRWTDLIRTGQAIEVMNKHGEEMKKLHPFILPGAFNVTPEKLVYPFHFRELDVNKELVQNPGY
jgi:SusD family.